MESPTDIQIPVKEEESHIVSKEDKILKTELQEEKNIVVNGNDNTKEIGESVKDIKLDESVNDIKLDENVNDIKLDENVNGIDEKSAEPQEEKSLTLENAADQVKVEVNDEIKEEIKEPKSEEEEEDETKQNDDKSPSEHKVIIIRKETKSNIELRNMLEDIEEGELDYGEEEEEGELNDDDLDDLPEYDPVKNKDGKKKEREGEDGEIVSDGEGDEEREEGEILDDDETGQVYICVDPVNDKWKKVSKEEQKRMQDLEEGQIDDPEEVVVTTVAMATTVTQPVSTHPNGRFIPRTLCKYFNNGLCRWGSTCRFLHPGINDKGIPADMQPTWNATAGNYVMHRPPGMYPNAFGKAPAPMECINIPVMPTPTVVDMSLLAQHPELVSVLSGGMMGGGMGVHPADMDPSAPSVRKESAWERGLRRAKEIKESALRRKEEDEDFEEKRKSMRIPESHVSDKDSDYEGGSNDWDIRDRDSKTDIYGRRHREERKTERYADKYSKKNTEFDKARIYRSMEQPRPAEQPPSSHNPVRREERQRQREREKREKDDERIQREREETELRARAKAYDPRMKQVSDTPSYPSSVVRPAPAKNIGAAEWHDPWMRSQPPPVNTQMKSEVSMKQPGVEAISDSDSSSSDSDSDSDSSSSDSSGSGSSSSGNENKPPKSSERRKERYRHSLEKKNGEANKPKSEASYEEWKRQQNQKAQQSKTTEPKSNAVDRKDPRSYRAKEDPRKIARAEAEEKKRAAAQVEPPMPRSISNVSLTKKPTQKPANNPFQFQFGASALTVRANANTTATATPPKNDDKFDSPKRKKASDTDSDSDSNSDSENESNSDSSDSDSDSDSDSESDSGTKARIQSMGGAIPPVKPVKPVAPPMDPSARKDIKLNLSEKPKPEVVLPAPVIGGKRPARKDELLKELKAVEDAIARKRAKID